MQVGRRLLCLILTCFILASAGCGPTGNSRIPIAKKTIQPGGNITYGSLQEPNTLNPLLSDYLSAAEVGRLIFSGLTLTNEKGEWVADLAEEVPNLSNGGLSADGLVIRYKLRKNVKWHDGVPFTANDVKFTWQIIASGRLNAVNRDGYDKIATVDTPDLYTVIIKFKEYYAPYLSLFSIILPEHILAGEPDLNKAPFNRSPIGTGPFKLREWRVGESVILDANGDYYRGRPKLDSLVYKVVPDSNAIVNQLKTGEIDIAGNIAFPQLEQVKSLAGVETIITPNLVWEHLDFNLDNPLFQDVRVRQAMALAIDKPAIINNLLKNVTVPAAGDQPPLSWAYNPVLKSPGRDVAAAQDLLAQAGWKLAAGENILSKDGRKFKFSLVTTSDNKTRELVAQAIAAQLKDVGIEVEVQTVEAQKLFEDIMKARRFEAAMYAWTGGVDPDNTILWHSKNIPSSANKFRGQNYPGWRNPEVDTLTGQATRTVDIESRKQMYYRIQDLIQLECPVIPLYFRINIDAKRGNIVNYRPNPTPAGNLWNAWEWGIAG